VALVCGGEKEQRFVRRFPGFSRLSFSYENANIDEDLTAVTVVVWNKGDYF
jgi:hypothetical protein